MKNSVKTYLPILSGLLICFFFSSQMAIAQTSQLINYGFETVEPGYVYSSGNSSTVARAANNARTGTFSAASIGGTGSNKIDCSVITPQLNLKPGFTYSITVYAKSNNGNAKIKIAKSATATNAAIKSASGSDILLAQTNVTNTTYGSANATTFAVTSTQNMHIGFQFESNSNNTSAWIDDILIEEICNTTANAGIDQSICSTTTTMAAAAAIAGSGLWSVVSGSGNFANNASPTTIVSNVGPGANVYRFTVTNGTCTPATSDVTITTINPPAITLNPANVSGCMGGMAVFTINASGDGLTYQWRKNGSGINNNANTNGVNTPTLTLTSLAANDAASYDIVVTGTCSPSVTSAPATLSVNALPSANATSNSPVCETGAILLDASGGISYTWSGPDNFSSAIQNPLINNVTSINAGAYTVTATDANGCSASASTNVSVTPCAIPTTQLNPNTCNITLSAITQVVYSVPVSGAQNYQYEITAPAFNAVYTRNSSSAAFSIGWVSGISYATTYDVRVRVFMNGVWGQYGSTCQLTTPATIPAPKLNPNSCGISIGNIYQTLYTTPIHGATNYEYEVSNITLGFTTNYIRNSASTTFSMGWIGGLRYGFKYNIRVRALVGGAWSAYGQVCEITTPNFVTTQLRQSDCNSILADINEVVHVDAVYGATNYEYTITDGGAFSTTYFRNSSSNSFSLGWVPATQTGVTYTITVKSLNGVWGPAGAACTLSTLTPQARNGYLSDASTKDATDFTLSVFPNPNTGQFIIVNVPPSMSGKVNASDIMMTDITGRIIEVNVTHTNGNRFQIIPTAKPTPGIYMVQIRNHSLLLTGKLLISK